MEKKVVITGGSKGIGRAMVELFIREGYSVCTCSRNYQDLEKLYKDLSEPKTLYIKECDVSDKASAKDFIDFCVKSMARIDVLINNASILGVRSNVETYPEDVWEEVIRININGVFYITKYALPHMERGGVIINFSSGAGKRPAPTWGAYAVSKFGIEGFSLLLAHELKERGIRVYAFNPGATRTQMRAQAYPHEDPTSLKEPEKVAHYVLNLLNSSIPTGTSVDYPW